MITLCTDNGELTLLNTSGTFTLDAVEEKIVGLDLVHVKKTHLELTRRDAAKLRKALTAMLRKPRPRRAAPVLAEECAT